MRNNCRFPAKIICAVLLCSLLLTAFSGCGLIVINKTVADVSATVSDIITSEGSPTEENTTGESTTPPNVVEFPSRLDDAKDALEKLYDLDLSAFDVMVAISNDTTNTLNPDESAPLYASRTLRNTMVTEKYDCDFFFFSADTEQLKTDLDVSVKSGSDAQYYADILALPENVVSAFIASNLILDLRRLPFYEIGRTGNDGAGMYISSNYVDVSAALDAPENIYALYFNRDLTGDEGADKLYSAALSEELTFEYLLSFINDKKTSSPDGVDLFAFGGPDPYEYIADAVSIRCGTDFTTDGNGTTPTVGWKDEEAVSVTALLTNIASVIKKDIASAETFTQGNVMFRVAPLSDIFEIYDKKTDWGLLPLPVYAGGTAMPLNVTCSNRAVFCVSANNSRTEMTGLVLTALDVASKDWIRDQFAVISIEQYMRDNNSCLTLRRILDSETYRDFSYIFAPVCQGLADATYGAARSCLLTGTPIADSVNAVRKKVNNALKKVY